jgi:hypothetical protein
MKYDIDQNEMAQPEDMAAAKRSSASTSKRGTSLHKRSSMKLDAENTIGGAVATHGRQETVQHRKSLIRSTTSPEVARLSNIGDQRFELPGTEVERPSTSHEGYAAENGLRLNGISTENLVGKAARAPNGRPKSLGAQPSSAPTQEQIKNEPMPHVARQFSSKSAKPVVESRRPPASTYHKSSSNAPAPATITSILKVPSQDRQRSKHDRTNSEKRTKNTYLDGVNTLTTKRSEPQNTSDEEKGVSSKSTSNASKRRSTITATPRVPIPPPPVPDSASSKKSKEVGKRRSFFSSFRRSTAN